jgi:copper chaperone CopZ
MTQKTISYHVPDMHCSSCPKLITMDLLELGGVIDVKAELDSHLVTVNYNSDLIHTDLITQSIKNSGYTPKDV